MTVTQEDTNEMARILAAMNGTPLPPRSGEHNNHAITESVELAGPGVPSRHDVTAMAQVLQKFSQITSSVASDMVTESTTDKVVREAISTHRNASSVDVGGYKINIQDDQTRLAGKRNCTWCS